MLLQWTYGVALDAGPGIAAACRRSRIQTSNEPLQQRLIFLHQLHRRQDAIVALLAPVDAEAKQQTFKAYP